MHRIIGLAIALGLASGLVGAFAYDQLGSDAGAAPPPPSATQVREQNVDGSGLIRVHEQGMANVNVINGSLPVSGTVNVGNLPSVAASRLIALTSWTPSGGGFYVSELVGVSDCKFVTVLVRGGALSQSAFVSPDGTTRIAGSLGSGISRGTVDGVDTSSSQSNPIGAPFLQVQADTAAGAGAPTGWIWCEP